jgi:hypothetical protein
MEYVLIEEKCERWGMERWEVLRKSNIDKSCFYMEECCVFEKILDFWLDFCYICWQINTKEVFYENSQV